MRTPEYYQGLPPVEQAKENLKKFRELPYPGRVVMVGQTDRGEGVQVYIVMGRSEGSKNRVLSEDDGDVWTAVADPSKLKGDPSTTIYRAMVKDGSSHIVTNGLHTEAVLFHKTDSYPLGSTMKEWGYEPDPSHTARIAGYTSIRDGVVINEMAINRQHHGVIGQVDRQDFVPIVVPGTVSVLQTYTGDGSTSAFNEHYPFRLPANGTGDEIADFYWDLLNPDYKVALAVKTIELDSQEAIVSLRNSNELKA